MKGVPGRAAELVERSWIPGETAGARSLGRRGTGYTLFAVRGGEDTVSLPPRHAGGRSAGTLVQGTRSAALLSLYGKRLERQRAGLGAGPPEKWIRTGWPICRTRCRNWRPGALFWKRSVADMTTVQDIYRFY